MGPTVMGKKRAALAALVTGTLLGAAVVAGPAFAEPEAPGLGRPRAAACGGVRRPAAAERRDLARGPDRDLHDQRLPGGRVRPPGLRLRRRGRRRPVPLAQRHPAAQLHLPRGPGVPAQRRRHRRDPGRAATGRHGVPGHDEHDERPDAPHLGGERGAESHEDAADTALCSSSQSAVSCQYWGIAIERPRRCEAPDHASDVAAASATSTTTPTATRLSRSGWAKACIHSARVALPGNGIRPSRCASPNASGSRSSGSSLCMLRNGVPADVEELLNLEGHRRSQPAGVAGGQHHDAHHQDRDQPSPGGHRGNASPARPPPPPAWSPAPRPIRSPATRLRWRWATYGVQAPVPRSISVSDIHRVVTPEDSMKSRNGGLIRPSSTNATTHHVTASTVQAATTR